MKKLKRLISCLVLLAAAYGGLCGCNTSGSAPADIQAVFNKPLYKNATWGLRVVDADGKVLVNLNPHYDFFVASVRKVFTVGELLNEVGPDHTYNTPVYYQGAIDSAGALQGNLILVASGDLSMGGRTNPDGTIAISNYDHNEADALGNAVLTSPDPLAGYKALAQQVASRIKKVSGDVIIDDRLFQPFNFRDEFNLSPIFVNDDVVDLTINPTNPGDPASVVWRPTSAALAVASTLMTGAPGSNSTLKLNPELPLCIGQPGCAAGITGQLPTDLVPPLTNSFPLIQTFRIVQPANYARTVFIEALQAAGVTVDAAPVAQNPVQLLPAKDSYSVDTEVAELTGMPYSDYAKLIEKVSYNVGADTSLLLFGLAHGVDNMSDALNVEAKNLVSNYGIPAGEFTFLDGSGGGDTTATNVAVTQMLTAMTTKSTFPVYFDSMPILAKDGSLSFVTDFQSDATLSGATGSEIGRAHV